MWLAPSALPSRQVLQRTRRADGAEMVRHMRERPNDAPPRGLAPRSRVGASMTWPPELPFSAVLEHARQRDHNAISRLYKRFLPTVYRYVLARVADPATAEDITADTFYAMLESIGAVRAQDELSFAAWLLGIARNKVAVHFRRGKSAPAFQRDLPVEAEPFASAEEDDPLIVITARESWTDVVRALNRLTEEQRAVVLYRCVLGYPTEDVAQLLGKQPGTIRALQFRALASLARYLGLNDRRGGDDVARR